jgi:hypothetical protein
MTDETAAIRAAVQTYLDGLYEGDADKLASIFHATSALTWEEAGVLTPLPRDQWLEAVRGRASAQARGLERQDQILQIDQASPTTAFVKLKCQIPPALLQRLPMLPEGGGEMADRPEGLLDRNSKVIG